MNILRGNAVNTADLGFFKNFAFKEHYRFEFRAEMFNAFNRANFGTPNASIGNAQAGQISGTAPARIQQAALKLAF